MEKVIDWITEKETHEIKYYDDSDVENTRTAIFKDDQALMQSKTSSSQETPYNVYKEAEYDEDMEDALIKELIEKEYIICGDTHQYYCLPVFENNRYIELSMRKWGEIMAEAWKLRGFTTRPNFYLKTLCSEEEKLPYEIKR